MLGDIDVGLTKSELQVFYKYLLIYTQNFENAFGSFDWEDHNLQQFCYDNSIPWRLDVSSQTAKDANFWFNITGKKCINGKNDIAHHFLRHLRNCIAHGYISKEGNFYKLKDYSKGMGSNLSMEILIKKDVLWTFVDKILETRIEKQLN